MIVISNDNLESFAKFMFKHGKRIYAVGGYIRGRLQGLSDEECGDIDLCSCCRIEELEQLKEEGNFEIEILNKTLGVCRIKVCDDVFEHATFRKEFYDKTGKHFPKQIEFINNLEEDALRRDFTVNAIYYDIIDKILVDPTNGLNDLNKGILKTVGKASERLCEDAERMLRAIRIAFSNGFNLDEELTEAIKSHVKLLQNVKPARRNKEINKLLHFNENSKTDVKNGEAVFNAFNALNNLGMIRYIMPELNSLKSTKKGKKIFERIILSLKYSDGDSGYILLFCGIVEGLNKHVYNNDIVQMLNYLFDTYYLDSNGKIKITLLQKTAQYCLKITKYGLKTKIISELKTENSVIIPLIANYFKAINLAKTSGKKSGRTYEKIKVIFDLD